MPWTASERPLSKRLPVKRLAAGGAVVERDPDPNSGIANYARSVAPRTNDLGIGQIARGVATSNAEDAAHAQDSFSRGVLTNIPMRDPKWQGLFQALAEAGAGHVQTGAQAGWDQTGPSSYDATTGITTKSTKPGFFENQVERMSRVVNTMTPRERALLKAMQGNPYAT